MVIENVHNAECLLLFSHGLCMRHFHGSRRGVNGHWIPVLLVRCMGRIIADTWIVKSGAGKIRNSALIPDSFFSPLTYDVKAFQTCTIL
jgi:hypothetical protein